MTTVRTTPRRIARLIGAAVVAALIAIGFDFYRTMHAPAGVKKPFDFEFTQGQTLTQLSDELIGAGLIPNRYYWRLYAILSGADRRAKAGMYRIKAHTTPQSLLDDLVNGNTIRYRFTLYEGWTLRETLEAMREHPQIVMGDDNIDGIRNRLGIAEPSPEGWIYPDTYLFEKGTNNLKLLRQGYELMKEKLTVAWETRNPELPFETPYEALILASIIEKETAVDRERRRIAGVFISRLKRGIMLQTDPTVIYGLGEAFDGDLRRRDLKKDTPYNSYTRTGLPPTPIAMPSEKSIIAALNPEITGDLYFVSKGDGSHHFSRTYEEHRTAVHRYQLGGKP